MNKIPVLKSKDLMRILKNAGFHEDHQSGSHLIMHSDQNGVRVVIPFRRRDLPMGTIHAIIRAAHLTHDMVLNLLHA